MADAHKMHEVAAAMGLHCLCAEHLSLSSLAEIPTKKGEVD